MQDKGMSWIQEAFIVAHEQSLSTDYDLDLLARDMIFCYNTSSCHDDH